MWALTVRYAMPTWPPGENPNSETAFGSFRLQTSFWQPRPCVGNNSADQNSPAPRLLALTLKQSAGAGHGQAEILGGRDGVRDVLPCRQKGTIGMVGSPPRTGQRGGVSSDDRLRLSSLRMCWNESLTHRPTEVLICFDRRDRVKLLNGKVESRRLG